MISLLVFTDGRDDCLEQTITSAIENLRGPISVRLINDDSGDADHRSELLERYAPLGFELVPPAPTRQGFGGAIRHAWAYVRQLAPMFVFHLEDDFLFRRPVDLEQMAKVLIEQPHLVQIALRRQAWNDAERAAGGVIEQHPDDYVQASNVWGDRWLEHRRFFTTNPSLYWRRLPARREWPDAEHSEGVFTAQLLADPDLRFAYWGDSADEPWVEHIGVDRAGERY